MVLKRKKERKGYLLRFYYNETMLNFHKGYVFYTARTAFIWPKYLNYQQADYLDR